MHPEYKKMVEGRLYDPAEPTILNEQVKYQNELWEFNQLRPNDYAAKEAYMKRIFAECGDDCYIELPFHANWGGHHVHFGSGIYANSNLTCVDDGHIYVGDKVMFGPNVTLATAGHPVDAEQRSRNLQFNRDIHIGAGSWLGAGVIVLPGITIGANTVIGAGSVVTKDIPDGVVAVGNPCRVLRKLTAADRMEE
ncbi:MAG: sugar O-acetyltransferase [Eubacteriales bacterium]|nr:sugar O-acetyltransferase [Eubacteriales bacterium]